MIYDSIKHLSAYRGLLPGIAAAEDFLAKTDIASLPAGRIELGAGVCVNVNLYDPKEDGKYEAHRNFIDLQYVVSGNEDMQYAPVDDAVGAQDYDAQKDIQFFDDADRAVTLSFSNGDFALFFPQDAHKPGLKNAETAGAVRKLVFKIPTPEYEPIAHIMQLCKMIRLPDDASDCVIAAVKRIPADLVRQQTEAFFADAGTNPSFDELANEIGVSVPICNLAMYMLFAKQTYYSYLKKGISADIYYDSMTDFTVWNTACMRKTGGPGLLQIGWLANTLRESLYRLGRFQYQPTTFEHSEYRFGDYVIRRGDPVITIHIPEGEPLTDAVRMDSYRRAEAFFGRHVFVCESWLLYPAHRDFLQKNSNIIRFMDDFVMLSSHESRGSLGDMWRMYGFSCDHTDFANLPEHTGMQRAYKKHLLESGGMMGGGYGILIVENGTIINK